MVELPAAGPSTVAASVMAQVTELLQLSQLLLWLLCAKDELGCCQMLIDINMAAAAAAAAACITSTLLLQELLLLLVASGRILPVLRFGASPQLLLVPLPKTDSKLLPSSSCHCSQPHCMPMTPEQHLLISTPLACSWSCCLKRAHCLPLELLLTIHLADVTTTLHAKADVQETIPLLAQQQQGLKGLEAQGLRLYQLKRNTWKPIPLNHVSEYRPKHSETMRRLLW